MIRQKTVYIQHDASAGSMEVIERFCKSIIWPEIKVILPEEGSGGILPEDGPDVDLREGSCILAVAESWDGIRAFTESFFQAFHGNFPVLIYISREHSFLPLDPPSLQGFLDLLSREAMGGDKWVSYLKYSGYWTVRPLPPEKLAREAAIRILDPEELFQGRHQVCPAPMGCAPASSSPAFPAPAFSSPMIQEPSHPSQIPAGDTVDDISFTVTSPASMKPGNEALIYVWMHTEDESKLVARKAKSFLGDGFKLSSVLNIGVSRNSRVKVLLSVPRLQITDLEEEMTWKGKTVNAGFPIYIPADAAEGSYSGVCLFLMNGIRIAKLNFLLSVSPKVRQETVYSTAKLYKSAFVSYASEDREEVSARLQGVKKVIPQMELFMDVVSLQSGDNWKDRLLKEIGSREVFYLFWSEAASRSAYVDWEWRKALELKGLDFIDPIPLVPPDVVPPPAELSAKHFNDWMLAYKRNRT